MSNSAQRYYTGSCDNVDRRLQRHNESRVSSTKYGVPWELVWYKKCDNRSEARKLELIIKKRGAKRFLSDQNSSQ
ncbi:GIY-YIG nuclease family protein [Rhodohalobacter barkolensis]|uniref:Excinuclease ABC subunit C n=1 Tax=Rhodohalobacter barkolensis TaxID=2053187 RepID=A0A2N0VGM6_9BACT|nr:excinuclease ABC subunit C [Rhodohalobacter barkolensis]